MRVAAVRTRRGADRRHRRLHDRAHLLYPRSVLLLLVPPSLVARHDLQRTAALVGSARRRWTVRDRRRAESNPDAGHPRRPAPAVGCHLVQPVGRAAAANCRDRHVLFPAPPRGRGGRARRVHLHTGRTNGLAAQPAEHGVVRRVRALGPLGRRHGRRGKPLRDAHRHPVLAAGALRRTGHLGCHRRARGRLFDVRDRSGPTWTAGRVYRRDQTRDCDRGRAGRGRAARVGAAAADVSRRDPRAPRRGRHARFLVAAPAVAVGSARARPVRQLLRRVPDAVALDGCSQFRTRPVFLLSLPRAARAAAGRAGACGRAAPQRLLGRSRGGRRACRTRRVHAGLPVDPQTRSGADVFQISCEVPGVRDLRLRRARGGRMGTLPAFARRCEVGAAHRVDARDDRRGRDCSDSGTVPHDRRHPDARSAVHRDRLARFQHAPEGPCGGRSVSRPDAPAAGRAHVRAAARRDRARGGRVTVSICRRRAVRGRRRGPRSHQRRPESDDGVGEADAAGLVPRSRGPSAPLHRRARARLDEPVRRRRRADVADSCRTDRGRGAHGIERAAPDGAVRLARP